MLVFHGSYCEITTPDIKYSRNRLDFGPGFYLTPIEEQAINWGSRFKRLGKLGIVNEYEIDFEQVKEKYEVLIFDDYSPEWLEFIIKCRNG
ncbi:MAG TPA: sortase, partial [Firmicutes bacterium]|nr:sortase [Bacillota bacterium]